MGAVVTTTVTSYAVTTYTVQGAINSTCQTTTSYQNVTQPPYTTTIYLDQNITQPPSTTTIYINQTQAVTSYGTITLPASTLTLCGNSSTPTPTTTPSSSSTSSSYSVSHPPAPTATTTLTESTDRFYLQIADNAANGGQYINTDGTLSSSPASTFRFSGSYLVADSSPSAAIGVSSAEVTVGIARINDYTGNVYSSNGQPSDTWLPCDISSSNTLTCDAGNGVSSLAICDQNSWVIAQSSYIGLSPGPPGAGVPQCKSLIVKLVYVQRSVVVAPGNTYLEAIQNPSFESGISPWYVVGTPSKTVVKQGAAYDGNYYIDMVSTLTSFQGGAVGSTYATLSQKVFTVPGVPYTLSYWYIVKQTVSDAFGCGLTVTANGQNVDSIAYNRTIANYRQRTASYTPSSNLTVLQFTPSCGLFVTSGSSEISLDLIELNAVAPYVDQFCSAQSTNVVINGGFEVAISGNYIAPWLALGNVQVSTSAAHSGTNGVTFYKDLASGAKPGLNQTLHGLIPGASHDLSFWYNYVKIDNGMGYSGVAALTAYIDGVKVFEADVSCVYENQYSICDTNSGWQYTFGSFTATSTTQVLGFQLVSPLGVTLYVDDISVGVAQPVCN